MIDNSNPQCVFVVANGESAFAIEFHQFDGQVDGFPYAYLLNYRFEPNPDADSQPHAPPHRFSLWFSTHDVVLLGWRLNRLYPLLRQARLAYVRAVDAHFCALAESEPFVSQIRVKYAKG